MTKLTSKQQAVLDYIRDYVRKHRRAPFIREIQTDCWIASYKSTVDRLNALERKGFIKRMPNKHRGIQLRRRALELIESTAVTPVAPSVVVPDAPAPAGGAHA